jgi:hypothetical protein
MSIGNNRNTNRGSSVSAFSNSFINNTGFLSNFSNASSSRLRAQSPRRSRSPTPLSNDEFMALAPRRGDTKQIRLEKERKALGLASNEVRKYDMKRGVVGRMGGGGKAKALAYFENRIRKNPLLLNFGSEFNVNGSRINKKK